MNLVRIASSVLGVLAAAPCWAQPLTAVVLQGSSTRPGAAQAAPPAPIVPGVRLQARPDAWMELAFSDGSSIVLEAGADFTLQSIRRGPDGRITIAGTSGRGRLRIAPSDDVVVALATAGVTVRVAASTAVVVAGAGGSVTLLSGSAVSVVRGTETETLRRPGFALALVTGDPQRQSRTQLADAVESFAPLGAAARARSRGGVQIAAAEATADQLSVNQQRLSGQDANAGTVAGGTAGAGTGGAGNGGAGTGGAGTGGAAAGGGQAGATGIGGQGAPIVTPPDVTPVVNPPVTPVVLPPEPPQPPQPPQPPLIRTPFSPANTLASAIIGGAPSSPSVIAAPGQDMVTASIDINGFVNRSTGTAETGELVVGLQYADFGAVRVRRLPPSRADDTARLAGVGVIDARYQNLLTTGLNPLIITNPGDFNRTVALPPDAQTVYDATARAGLTTQSVAVAGQLSAAGDTIRVGVAIADVNTPAQTIPTNPAFARQVNITFPAITTVNFNVQPGGATALAGSQVPLRLGSDANESGLLLYLGPAVQTASATPVLAQPNIYVIDKVTAGLPDRGIQPGERYFAIGGTAVGDGLQNALPGNGGTLPAGTVSRFGISDGLNPTASGGLNTVQDLPTQFAALSGGGGNAFTAYNAFRPESSFPGQGQPRGDTHLYVVAGDGTAARPNAAMRADLQVLPNGASTGAVSTGGIVRGPGASQPLVLAGQTIGSTRLLPGQAALPITSNLGSLSTGANGQSVHLLGAAGLNGGQVSYFAVSQADPRLGSVATSSPATATTAPATVQAGSVGAGGAATPFAFTRLATNVGTGMVQAPDAAALQGFAATMVERQGSSGGIYSQSSTGLGSVQINRAANANTFSASIQLQPTSAGQPASDPLSAVAPVQAGGASLAFGDPGVPGATPRSAWVSNSTFAATGNGVAMASVDASLLQGIPNAAPAVNIPGTGTPATGADLPASNQHVAWGYFLGDLATGSPAAPDRANLGFWVAGRPVDASVVQTLSGTATYAGGMIGTAVDGAGIRTVAGRFAQSWDFGARTGALNANFDGRSWTGVNLTMPGGTGTFAGSGVSGDRALTVQGGFFNAGPLTGGALPAGVGGAFGIFSPTYGANGVFVGSKR